MAAGKANGGAPGVDRMTIEDVEKYGVDTISQ